MMSFFLELLLRHFKMMGGWLPLPSLLPLLISAFSLHCKEQFYTASDSLTKTVPIFCTSLCFVFKGLTWCSRSTETHPGLTLSQVWDGSQDISAPAALSAGGNGKNHLHFSQEAPAFRTCYIAHNGSLNYTSLNIRPFFLPCLNFQAYLLNEWRVPSSLALSVLWRGCCGSQGPSLMRSTENCKVGTWSSVDLLERPQQVMMLLPGIMNSHQEDSEFP